VARAGEDPIQQLTIYLSHPGARSGEEDRDIHRRSPGGKKHPSLAPQPLLTRCHGQTKFSGRIGNGTMTKNTKFEGDGEISQTGDDITLPRRSVRLERRWTKINRLRAHRPTVVESIIPEARQNTLGSAIPSKLSAARPEREAFAAPRRNTDEGSGARCSGLPRSSGGGKFHDFRVARTRLRKGRRE